ILESENPKEKIKEFKDNLIQNKIEKEKNLKKENIKTKLNNLLKFININDFNDEKLLNLEMLINNLEKEIL
ncbi:MAG: hypothetical protein ACRCSY_08800, partial [Cetobacterium sp.]